MYNNISCLTQSINNVIDKTQHAVLNSGCTTHTLQDDAPSEERQPTPEMKICGTPTRAMMSANDKALIPFHTLPKEATQSHHYPNIRYKSLLLVGQFCDARYRT